MLAYIKVLLNEKKPTVVPKIYLPIFTKEVQIEYRLFPNYVLFKKKLVTEEASTRFIYAFSISLSFTSSILQ